MICESQNSSRRRRCSTTVTLQPSAANIDAYSMPITPAPTTTSEFGSQSRPRMSSELRTRWPSNATVAGLAGRVPTAITIFAAVTRRSSPDAAVTFSVCGSAKRAWPFRSTTWFRASWARTTSMSRCTTCCVRWKTSCDEMSSLTR